MAHWRTEAAWTRPYVPVIRGYAGELDALAWLPDSVKQRVMPLLEVVPGRVERTARVLGTAWGDTRPILLDTVLLEDDATDTRNHQLVELFERCSGTLRAIPVGGLERGIDHTAALAGVAAAHRRGAALRATPTDLWPGERRQRQLDGWLAVVDLGPEDVDLVIEIGEVREPSHVPTLLSAREALAELPYARDWRSVTLASAGSPAPQPCGNRDYEDLHDRLDWRLWKMVSGGELPRHPGFGDHVTRLPSATDPHGGTSITYTTGCNWLVVKRRRLAPRADELRALSQALLARPEFAGGTHCRGCATIEEFATGGSPGGLEGWRAAGVCHHIEASVAELSALVG